MAVKYIRLPSYMSRDRERVSKEWRRALLDAWDAGVRFNVNEGHRTMARQWELYRQLGPYNGSSGAAYPSTTAPHIRVGRIDHAIDCDGAATLVSWLRKHGIYARTPVGGEPWHIEASSDDLARYFNKKARKNREVRSLLRKAGYSIKVNNNWGKKGKNTVKKFQREQGIKADGIPGPVTMKRLRGCKPTIKPNKGNPAKHDVKAAKYLLRKAGYRGVGRSSRRGVLYRRAVRDFKRKHNLTHNAVFGPKVWRLLRK